MRIISPGCGIVAAAWARAAAAAPVLALIAACGGGTLQEFVADESRPYAKSCATVGLAHDKAVKDMAYLPPEFKALTWPLPLAPDADGMLPEQAFFRAVRDGKVRFAFVQARGGIGKSELSKALVADSCDRLPAFRVDLIESHAGAPVAQNRLLGAIAAQLGIAAGSDDHGALEDRLAQHRWLLVLDSIDEVPGTSRAAIFRDIAEVRTRFASAQVVMLGRPSIYENQYGIAGLDAILEVPPLDCSRARSVLTATGESPEERHRMASFISTWQVDRQSVMGQQCWFPYLATYRDIQVVQRLAKDFEPNAEMGGLQATLTQVHEAVVAERLQKELVELGWSGEQTLKAVDAMVRKGGYQEGEWNLVFTVDRCLSSQEGGDTAANRHVCEKFFQSVLFERIAGAAEWRFGHQALADLFVARWLEDELLRNPGSCAAVDAQAEMFASKEIGGYLVGRPHGARCLSAVTRAMCKEGGFKKSDVALLYKGLPLGPQRGEIIKAAKEFEASHGAEPCATQTLGAL